MEADVFERLPLIARVENPELDAVAEFRIFHDLSLDKGIIFMSLRVNVSETKAWFFLYHGEDLADFTSNLKTWGMYESLILTLVDLGLNSKGEKKAA